MESLFTFFAPVLLLIILIYNGEFQMFLAASDLSQMPLSIGEMNPNAFSNYAVYSLIVIGDKGTG